MDFIPLNKDKVEKGEILKTPDIEVKKIDDIKGVFKRSDVISEEQIALKICYSDNMKLVVSRLVLYPGAKIKYHEHTKDSEWYIPLNTDEILESFCMKGNGHSLENTTDEIIEILSIKIS